MRLSLILLLVVMGATPAQAQFFDDFDDGDVDGWEHSTGDGVASMDMVGNAEGYASVFVDATSDRDNIWWALIRRPLDGIIDPARLEEPHMELRIETRIRASHAPRRVNLHFNTQRTTDFHTHLTEYDIPDTSSWQTISMTTRDFDGRAGDAVNAQMALIDWGLERYRLDIDYYRVDVVDTNEVGPDVGPLVPYPPPVAPVPSFDHHAEVVEAGMIALDHPDTPMGGWYAGAGRTPVVTVDGARYVVLRWDLSAYAGREPAGPGLLTLTTHSLERVDAELPEYGQVRLVEILGGDPDWDAGTVTLDSFTDGLPLNDILNSQMIVDWYVAEAPGDTTRIAINEHVLGRLIEGRTLGIALRPLGPISASFHKENDPPTLHFDLEP